MTLRWLRWPRAERAHAFIIERDNGYDYGKSLCMGRRVNVTLSSLRETDDPDERCGNCDGRMRARAKPGIAEARRQRANKRARERKTVYIPKHRFEP